MIFQSALFRSYSLSYMICLNFNSNKSFSNLMPRNYAASMILNVVIRLVSAVNMANSNKSSASFSEKYLKRSNRALS